MYIERESYIKVILAADEGAHAAKAPGGGPLSATLRQSDPSLWAGVRSQTSLLL